MKRTELLNTLKLAAPALLSDSEVVLPVLKSFYFTGSAVIASNDVISITLDTEVDTEAIVPGKKLISFLSACKTKEVKFTGSAKDPGSVVVTCGRSKLNLPLVDEEWPFPEGEPQEHFVLKVGEDFLSALELCASQSPDTGLGSWNGAIVLTLGKSIGIYGVGRGQTTISHGRVKINAEDYEHRRVAIPSSFCKAAAPLAKEYGQEAELFINDETVSLDWNQGRQKITCKRINVDLPDIVSKFRSVIKNDLDFTPIQQSFISAISKAAMIGDKGRCDVSSHDGFWLLKATADDGTLFQERVKFEEGVPEVKETISADLVSKRFSYCSEIAIHPDATVMRSEDKRFVYLVGNPTEEAEE